MDFELSKENLIDIPFHKYENNFTFIVNGKQYSTNRLVADILSPNIKKLHFTDSSINEYSINTKNDESKESYFQDFLSLAMYQTAKLDLIHQKYYLDYFYQLGNIDEYIRLLQDPSQDLSADVTFDQLSTIIKLEEESNKTVNSDDKSIKRIISYAASHFEEINKEKIKILDVDMLYEILNNDNLKLSSEDSLLEFILSIYKEDPKYSILFELVLFNNTSQESFEKFINEIEFYDINTSTWHSICSKFNESTKIYNNNSKRYKSHSLDFEYTKGKEFNGIFQYLTQKTKGNIADNGTIEIKSSSTYENNLPRNLVDFDKSNFFQSMNDKTIVCFDLKDKLFQLTDYSIKSHNSGSYSRYHLKDWVVEVSLDGETWEVVDDHKNDSSLNGPNISASFSTKKNKFFLSLRKDTPDRSPLE